MGRHTNRLVVVSQRTRADGENEEGGAWSTLAKTL